MNKPESKKNEKNSSAIRKFVLPREKLAQQPNYQTLFHTTILPKLMEKFGYKNEYESIKFEKIILSTSFSRKKYNPSTVHRGFEILALTSGQVPMYTRIAIPVANFGTRKGMVIGSKVTLRNAFLFEFLERLHKLYLPQSRFFNGFKPSSVRGPTFSLGISDSSIFPEISSDLAILHLGLTVTFCFTRGNKMKNTIRKEEILELLSLYSFPISNT